MWINLIKIILLVTLISNCDKNIESKEIPKKETLNTLNSQLEVAIENGLCFIMDDYPIFPKLLKERLGIQLTELELKRLVSILLVKKNEISFLTFSTPTPFTYILTKNSDETFQFGPKDSPIIVLITFRNDKNRYMIELSENKKGFSKNEIVSFSSSPKNGTCLDYSLIKEFKEEAIQELEVGSEPDGPPKIE